MNPHANYAMFVHALLFARLTVIPQHYVSHLNTALSQKEGKVNSLKRINLEQPIMASGTT